MGSKVMKHADVKRKVLKKQATYPGGDHTVLGPPNKKKTETLSKLYIQHNKIILLNDL